MADDPLWYKDAIIYELHVRAFADSNGDGIGDFRGLTGKLDYLQDLGVTALWLLPFYPSPLRDDGYDISDYTAVHPSYGTMQDFRAFLREAHRRGLRVITELIINHTSDQHPWFQAARRASKGSAKRNFYVWSDTKHRYEDVRIIFIDSEPSNWTWDEVAGQYFWHRFFRHQPDLNFDNPHVLRAVVKVMRFWLDMGVDGLRLDAIPYLIERDGTNCENLPETHDILKQIRSEVDRNYQHRMLLAEANQWPADVRPYFGDGDECHMAFHFPLMPRIFMALRQEDRHPITEILRQTPDIPESCQWALFLRNHDELTLEMVTDEERDYMYREYAADSQMRLNLGIRRRLAPLMENSRPRIELLCSLLFSLPGTPVIYYGDEIGMGDNIYLGDRNGVRTPMQWTGDRNAGFSRADPARLFAPPIMDPVYGYQSINVEAQERSPYSLLNWMKRMIALRRQHKTFGRGSIEFLHPRNRKVLAYARRLGDDIMLAVANLARSVQPVELDLRRFAGLTPIEMLGRTEFPRIGANSYFLTLAPYSFYWFELERNPTSITARVPQPIGTTVEEVPPLITSGVWETLLDGNVRTLIERDSLVPFLHRQRWFGGKARPVRSARIVDWTLLVRGQEPAFLTFVEVEYANVREKYIVPLAVRGHDAAEAIERQDPGAIVARVTGARKGALIDGGRDERLARALLVLMEKDATLAMRRGTVQGRSAAAFVELRGPETEALSVARAATEQTNTSLVFGNRIFMKLFRRVEEGPNPDLEMTEYLSEVAGFTRVPRLAGGLEYRLGDHPSATLALAQQRVPHQANGWDHAIGDLGRYFERAESRSADVTPETGDGDPIVAARQILPPLALDIISAYLESAATLGRRTAEMHLALGRETTDPAFAPKPLDATDLRKLSQRMVAQAERSLGLLETVIDRLPAAILERARFLLDRREMLGARLQRLATLSGAATGIRIHGDYHLGQVLWTEGDFVIFDFEGEPLRSVAERREKQSPLKDVAGMLRSFSYAAYAGLFAYTATRPGERDRLEGWARFWQTWTAATFLQTYLTAVAATHAPPLLPAGDALGHLLEAFMLEKALYELEYELNNRPDWVRIPLWGILAHLER